MTHNITADDIDRAIVEAFRAVFRRGVQEGAK